MIEFYKSVLNVGECFPVYITVWLGKTDKVQQKAVEFPQSLFIPSIPLLEYSLTLFRLPISLYEYIIMYHVMFFCLFVCFTLYGYVISNS